MAAQFLSKRGYRILETNYCCSEAEIDTISYYGDFIVLTEVGTKRDGQFDTSEESIAVIKNRDSGWWQFVIMKCMRTCQSSGALMSTWENWIAENRQESNLLRTLAVESEWSLALVLQS